MEYQQQLLETDKLVMTTNNKIQEIPQQMIQQNLIINLGQNTNEMELQQEEFLNKSTESLLNEEEQRWLEGFYDIENTKKTGENSCPFNG